MTVFPSLNVQIGFLAASDAVNTAPYMTFNDPVNGLFDTGQFAATYAWSNVTTDIRSVNTNLGRQRQIEAFSASTCTFVLDNNLGSYDPDNPASIYYGAVLPMRPVEITASWNGTVYPLFYGYIDSIVPGYASGRYSDAWVSINATDGTKILQNIPTDGGAAPVELTGARINRILDAVGWPTNLRDIAAGDVYLQARTLTGATAATDIQTAVDSEAGRWYISPAGKVTFENRNSRSIVQTSSQTWSDTSTTGSLYSNISRIIDDDLIRNRVTIQNISGQAQTLTDSASITQYQERSYSSSGLWLTTDDEARQLAYIALYNGKYAASRIDGIDFQPVTQIAAGAAGDLWPVVLGTNISDSVDVVITPPNLSAFTTRCYVEGMSHTITAQPVQDWHTSFHASRAPLVPWLQFNDATFGTIGTTNCFAA